VAVSSSNAPRFDPNPNTGEPFMQQTTTLVAQNRVYHQPLRASHLLLPVSASPPSGVVDGAGDGAREFARGAGRLRLDGPNPSSHDAALRLVLDRPGAGEVVVVDAAGRRVRRLVAGLLPAGETQIHWDGRNDEGAAVGSGLFWCVLRTAGQAESRAVVRLRGPRP
jgi:hypothetical protein